MIISFIIAFGFLLLSGYTIEFDQWWAMPCGVASFGMSIILLFGGIYIMINED